MHSVSDAAGNVGSASRQVDVGMSNINVLWQSPPAWDSTTAMKIAAINPAKLIISIDGGAWDSSTSTAGPSATQLVQFITDLTTHGYTGELVMHPDTNHADFLNYWHSPLPDSTSTGLETWMYLIDHEGIKPWQLYIDYFKDLNIALHSAGQSQMTELLIETGNGTTMPHTTTTGDPFPSITSLNDLFTSFKTYMNDSSVTISATGDWLRNYFPTSADYYYAQMYDMCSPPVGTIYPCLCGVNIPDASGERAQLIAESMVPLITGTGGVGALPTSSDPPSRLDKVSFIFTYAPTATSSAPGQNSPMFGEHDYFWTKSQFTNGTIMENDAIKQTGFIWWFKTKMDVHYSHAGISGRASTGLWHSEVILDARWNTIP